MIELARQGATDGSRFQVGEISGLDLTEKFDLAIMMFAVLGYQLSDRDVAGAFEAGLKHLRPGGLLIFDFWYGPAVIAEKPGPRTKEITTPGGGRLIRHGEGRLEATGNLCTVDYRIETDKGEVFQEQHRVRYFFGGELEGMILAAGFVNFHLGYFPDYETAPGPQNWNVLGIATAP